MSAGHMMDSSGLLQLLNRCRRQVFLLTLLRGLAETSSTLIACVLVACSIDFLIPLPAAARLLMLLSSFVLTTIVAWRRLLRPLATPIAREEIGAAVDLAFPGLQERMATLLSLSRETASRAELGSDVMREHLGRELSSELSRITVSRTVNSSATLRRCLVAIAVLSIAVLPLFVWSSGSSLLLQRLVLPFANLGTGGNFFFEVPEGNRIVAAGSDVTFAAIPRWRTETAGQLPSRVQLELRSDEGHVDSLTMSFDELAGQFTAILEDARQSLDYRIVGGGALTPWYRLKVADPPQLLSAILKETPPAYTGRPVEIHEGIIGRIPVFERSDIEILLTFSEPVRNIQMVWKEFRPITSEIPVDEFAAEEDRTRIVSPTLPIPHLPDVIAPDGLSARIRLTAMGSGRFEFRFVDLEGLENGSEPERRLATIEDVPPELEATGLEAGLTIRADDIAPIDVRVTDDLGLGVLELYVSRNDEVERIITAEGLEVGAKEWNHQFRIPLEDLQAKDGDQINIRVRAADERPIPEPNEVWKSNWSITISDDAEALGKQPLRDEDQQLINALKLLQEELKHDADQGQEILNQLWKEWNPAAQQLTRELSEKEQTQSRELQGIAQEVAEHPLMEKQAEDLADQANRLKSEISERLKSSAGQPRDDAAASLQSSISDLRRESDQLGTTIAEIERRARLEQELTELNRLALDAEQLAKSSESLEQDRQEGRPAEGQSEAQFAQELQDRASELGIASSQLGQELNALLQREQELLTAARKAESDKLNELHQEAAKLAQQQQQIADGVAEESRDAARTIQPVAEQLNAIQQDQNQLRQEAAQNQIELPTPGTQPLETAQRSLREGNLKEAGEHVAAAKAELEEIDKSIEKVPDPDAENPISDEQRQLRQRLNDKAKELGRRLDEAEQSILNSLTERTKPGDAQTEGARGFVQRLEELADAADGLTNELREDAAATASQAARNASQHSENTAQRGEEAVRSAKSGQFGQSAERMRQAADSAAAAANQLSSPEQADRQQQFKSLEDQYRRLAESASQMQLEDSVQTAAQQQGQRNVNDRVQPLPEQLSEIAERMDLPALNMQQQARQARESAEAAAAGREAVNKASEELESGELRSASESGHQAAGQLNRAAQLAQQGGSNSSQPEILPPEVGENVTDALQSLNQAQQAAQSMQNGDQQSQHGSNPNGNQSGNPEEVPGNERGSQQSQSSGNQNSQGQNDGQGQQGQESGQGQAEGQGQGQPEGQQGNQADGDQQSNSEGQGSSSGEQNGKSGSGQSSGSQDPSASQSLSNVAKALAEAAKNSLPQRFTPGQLNSSPKNKSRGGDGTGNDQLWDGRNAPRSNQARSRRRDWGKLQDELQEEIQDGAKDVMDSEYSDLIRNYRRALARDGVQEDQPATPQTERGDQ